MWTLLLWLACAGNEPPGLPAEAQAAKSALADELKNRDPQKVSRAAEHAAQWEGQDAQLDRLIGDALGNVLMNASDGFRLLSANPAPDDPTWAAALLAAASRTADEETMSAAWSKVGRPVLPFHHPVVGQVVRRMHADPHLGFDGVEHAIHACTLLDAQPSVGRRALDHPVTSAMLEVSQAVGATQVVVGRPIFRTDPDPQSGRGGLQCLKKVWLEDGWPNPVPRALTVALTDGVRKVYVDIRIQEGEPWAFATSDPVAAGRWLEAMKLWTTPNGPAVVRAKFAGGLWVSSSEEQTP